MPIQIPALLYAILSEPIVIPTLFAGTLVCANLMMPATQKAQRIRYQIKRFLSDEHTAHFHALQSTFPHYRILPHVSAAAVIENVRQHKTWHGRIDSLVEYSFDFAIYDRDFDLVCLVQLDDGEGIELDDLLSEFRSLPTLRLSKHEVPTNDQLKCALYLATIDLSRTFQI